MGCYVNPSNQSKEEFLNQKGEEVSLIHANWGNIPEGFLPVILVNNGPFTAAGVAFSKSEFEAFTMPNDYRPKQMFLVSIIELKEVSDIGSYLKKA